MNKKNLNKMLCPRCDKELSSISGRPKFLACTKCKRVFPIIVSDAENGGNGFIIGFIKAFFRGLKKIAKNLLKKM